MGAQCTGNQRGVDYLWLLHPSRIFGPFGVESCTSRARGSRAGLFLPTKSLLDLCCACSAPRNSSAGGWSCLGRAVDKATVLIKPQPGTLSQANPSLPLP